MNSPKDTFYKKQQTIILWVIISLALITIVLVAWDMYSRQRVLTLEEEARRALELERELVPGPHELSPDRTGEIIDRFVPEPDTILSDEERQVVAVPSQAASANPISNTESKNRHFSFELKNDDFVSTSGGKEIHVYNRDLVTLEFTALDNDYDILIPDYFSRPMIIRQGETEIRRFQAIGIGSSIYYCQVCGGPESAAAGLIVVHER